jgi:hypothetical protein
MYKAINKMSGEKSKSVITFVAFYKAHRYIHKDQAPENFVVLRHFAFNLLKVLAAGN